MSGIPVDRLGVLDFGIVGNIDIKGVCLKARVRLWTHQCQMATLRVT